MAPLLLGMAALAASVVAMVFYREAAKVRDEIVSTPTSLTSSIEKPGYYEVKGVANSENPLNDPRTETPCVFYHHKLTRTMREPHYSGGRNSSSDKTHTIMDDSKGIPFFLCDESGSIGVDGTSAEVHGELNDLVDRGSKLAFQIAMEVTRLGPRGERLLPMSKTLEDLTTDFRKAVDSLPAGEADDSPDNSAMSSVSAKLDTLEELLKAEMETDHDDLSGPISKAAPVAARLAEDLAGLAGDFNGQGDRLNEIGTGVADLSGQTFEPESAPEPKSSLAEVEPLVLDRQEPKKTSRVTDADPEPFVDHSRGFPLDPEPVLETPLSGDGPS